MAPRSTARTTRAAGLNANVAGGRPPVELASPAGATNPDDEQEVDPGGDRGARLPGERGQVGAGAGLPVTEELEHLPGARRPGGELEELVHAHSEPFRLV